MHQLGIFCIKVLSILWKLGRSLAKIQFFVRVKKIFAKMILHCSRILATILPMEDFIMESFSSVQDSILPVGKRAKAKLYQETSCCSQNLEWHSLE